MLLATGAVALSKKISDDRAKKKLEKQGELKVGDSNVAKQAFVSQTSQPLQPGDASVDRRGTEIRFEDPSDVAADDSLESPSSPNIDSPRPEIHDARHTSQMTVLSPARSEKGLLEPSSPYTENPLTPSDRQSLEDTVSSRPPPYSPRAESSSALSTSMYSRATDSASVSSFDARSVSVRSTNSGGTHAVRIRTIGSDLKSGFPYHPALFDLKVHPEKWSAFTSQVVDSLKFSVGDHARMWSSATAMALTGAIGTSIFVGRTVNRSIQEKKVKAGLTETTDGSLGETLKHWNDEYFAPLGLFVHLELSESAMKNANQKSTAFRKAAFLYPREDQERKKEERKFVIVVTKLDNEGEPTEALQELSRAEETQDETAEGRSELEDSKAVEIGSSDGPTAGLVELPGDAVPAPVELPADSATMGKVYPLPPSGFAEMDSDNTLLLEKLHIDEKNEGDSHYQPDERNTLPSQRAEQAQDDVPPRIEVQHDDVATASTVERRENTASGVENDAVSSPVQSQRGVTLYDGAAWPDDW